MVWIQLNGGHYYRWWAASDNGNYDCPTSANTDNDQPAGFGDSKALDVWAYESTTPVSNTLNIISTLSGAVVATSVTVPPTTTPGDTVYGSFVFSNSGDTSATGVTYSVVLSNTGGGSCPSSVTIIPPSSPSGISATYNNSSPCTITLSGTPSTLTSGQSLAFGFNYVAPSTGTVQVDTQITSTNSTTTATATDSTQIITADVITSVSVPTTAVAGSTVTGSFSFSNNNLATATAQGVVYTATIGSSGNYPAAVTFTTLPSGVTASYNPTDGTVTFTGMPTSLDPSDILNFGFSYTAPTSGSVPVNTSISTTTDESNTTNNSASGSTSITQITTISGTVFDDLNGNGIQNSPSETGTNPGGLNVVIVDSANIVLPINIYTYKRSG